MSDGTTTNTLACPECGSEDDWGGTSWCPSCGYYPAINFRQPGEDEPLDADEEYEHWWEVIPGWFWVLIAGSSTIVVISISVRLMFPDSPIRTWWTIGQMASGVLALGTVHMMAYLYSASRSDQFGPLDMFLRPVATWQPVLRGLPESGNLVCWLCFSITAILLACFVLDGVDYVALMQAEAAARKQARAEQAATGQCEDERNAMGLMICASSTVAQAQSVPGGVGVPCTLNGAVRELGGCSSVRQRSDLGQMPLTGADSSIPESIARDSLPATSLADPSPTTSPGSPANLPSLSLPATTSEVECLVLGYTTNPSGEIRSILLAAAPDRKFLRFVAKVPVDQVDPRVLGAMLARFTELSASRPMVRCPYGGRWLQPELFCMVNFDGWTADSRLSNVAVTRLMNTQSD